MVETPYAIAHSQPQIAQNDLSCPPQREINQYNKNVRGHLILQGDF